MSSLNKVMVIGNVGREPEVRSTPGGSMVANFTVATTERYKAKDGTYNETTEWHRIVMWKRLAEIAEQYIRKGSKVYIEGKLQTRSWDDKDGNKRYQTEVIGERLVMLDSKPQNQNYGTDDF